ncbi:MAG TPA: hypothetical protein ENH90_01920 [bacterium]|nr:hypothetical protein [bacterium]
MTEKDLLKEELETYETNKSKLIESSLGKFVLIKGKEIVNTFESEKDAINSGFEKFGNVPFLVKKIEEVEQTQNFTSNLIHIPQKQE